MFKMKHNACCMEFFSTSQTNESISPLGATKKRLNKMFPSTYAKLFDNLTSKLTKSKPRTSAMPVKHSLATTPFFASPSLSTMSGKQNSADRLEKLELRVRCATNSSLSFKTWTKFSDGRWIKENYSSLSIYSSRSEIHKTEILYLTWF